MKRATTALMGIVLMGAAFSAAEEKKPSFAQVCGVDTARASDGVFAKESKKQWNKYAGVKEVPHSMEEELAQVWRGEQGSFVQIAAKHSGFARYHEYCFDGSGKLTRLNYEVRSPYGWGFARTNVMKNGELTPVTQRFFGLKSNRTIPRPPDEARDAQWALYPKVYKSFDKLPFAESICGPVGGLKPCPCEDAPVPSPNLVVQRDMSLKGTLRDQTTAPFQHARLELRVETRRQERPYELVTYTTTDSDGNFEFGNVSPGRYRFLLIRGGFFQPEHLDCGNAETCDLNLVIEAAGTDQIFGHCPIQ